MSENTPNLLLPFLLASQAQKHVTVNEALRILDGLVQLSVLQARAAPPAAPVPGARYLVSASATGLWTGWEGSIALRDDNAWRRLIPQEGWLLWNVAAEEFQRFDGTDWVTLELGANVDFALGEIDALGVATQADATNRLAIASPAALLTHAGAGHQLKINKAAAGDTASVLFQTGFSGRAEMGLAGEDDFSFKVSPDGAQWRESIRINRTTGKAVVLGVRETLLAPRTYYVRKDGNDSNTGLADTAGGAFLTIGRAIDVVYGELDLGPFDVTIQVRAGVYEEIVYLVAPSVGAGSVLLRGEAANPGAVTIRVTSSTPLQQNVQGVVQVWNGAFLRVADIQVERVSGPSVPAIDVRFGGHLLVEPGHELRIGTASSSGIRLIAGFFTGANATIRNVGNVPSLINTSPGYANINAATIDVTGRHFSTAMFRAARGSAITNAGSLSFIGAATGVPVRIESNGVIDFGSRSLSEIPGSEDAVIQSGGVYLPGFGEVVERGSNPNGSYIRFAEGSQICTHVMDFGDRTTHGAGTYANPWRSASQTWTFPAAFMGAPTISATGAVASSSAQRRANSGSAQSVSATQASSVQFVMLTSDSSSGGGTENVTGHLQAIGRWK